MSRIVRPLVVALTTVAVLLTASFMSLAPAPSTISATPTATMQVDPGEISLVADGAPQDCFYAAAEIYGGLAQKGLKVAVSLAKWKSFFVSVAGLIPGVGCGKYLGHYYVSTICYFSQRPWYVPGALTAKSTVLFYTGGKMNRCVN